MLDDEGKMNNGDYGRIIFWGDRGYGFIRPDIGDRDVFVHVSECELPEGEEMQLGDRVTYEVGADRRCGKEAGICARQVRLINGEAK